MDLDRLRNYCLSFPYATEKLQWEDNLCFKVGGKIFAILTLGSVPAKVCFKCAPESFAELTERAGIVPAPYLGRYQWVLVEALDVLPGHELERLIDESYGAVAAKARVGRPRLKREPPRPGSQERRKRRKRSGRKRSGRKRTGI
jgi:predicted DNA-binding protein (MmcQ/YjbR family)